MRISSLFLALGISLPAAAQAPPSAVPPLRIVGKAEAVTFQEGGATRTYYRIVPGKPIELATSGEMTLLIPARALSGGAGAVAVSVLVTSPGAAPSATREVLGTGGPAVALSNGMQGLAPKVIRVPILLPTATVRISVDAAPGAIVGFARTAPAAAAPAPTPTTAVAAATPKATPVPGLDAAPKPTPVPGLDAVPPPTPDPGVAAADPSAGMPVMPLPLIRRRVERLGLGPRVAYLFPAGAVDMGAGGTSNLYAGAELRFTPPVLERRLAFTAEGGTYSLRDVEPLNATSPFGIATDGEVKITTRVTPLLGGMLWRVKLGSADRRAVFAGANGGVVLTTRTEEVEFRGPTNESETRYGAQGRIGFEQKLGPGRTVVEASYLHVTAGENEVNDTYLGGALIGLQYRFVF